MLQLIFEELWGSRERGGGYFDGFKDNFWLTPKLRDMSEVSENICWTFWIFFNHHGPEFLKNTLRITRKLIAVTFSPMLSLCIVLEKNNNQHILFHHVNFKDQNFQKFCYICALTIYVHSFQNFFQIVRKLTLRFFEYKNFYET